MVDRESVERVGAFASRTFLELSEIEAAAAPGILYGVYLHDADQAPDEALIGIVSFFGAEDAGKGRGSRHHHRLRYVFDVTDALAALGVSGPIAVGAGHGLVPTTRSSPARRERRRLRAGRTAGDDRARRAPHGVNTTVGLVLRRRPAWTPSRDVVVAAALVAVAVAVLVVIGHGGAGDHHHPGGPSAHRRSHRP